MKGWKGTRPFRRIGGLQRGREDQDRIGGWRQAANDDSLCIRRSTIILQDLDGAFQAHAARTFHQHYIAFAQILCHPFSGGFGIGRKATQLLPSTPRRPAAAHFRARQPRCRAPASAAAFPHAAWSCGPCSPNSSISPATRMRRRPRGRRWDRQSANHRAQRLGIGVVAVVENGGA